MSIQIDTQDSQVVEVLKQLRFHTDIIVQTIYRQGQPLQIEKTGDNATVYYGRRVELFRGLGLLAEYQDQNDYHTIQPARFKMDGVMIDCSHNGVMKPEVVKTYIRYMALMGLDTIMLYTRDTYEVPEYPYLGYMRGRYSQKELKELDDYAYSYGVEMIPCIQTLAHLEDAFRWPCFNDVKDCDNILLCGNDPLLA